MRRFTNVNYWSFQRTQTEVVKIVQICYLLRIHVSRFVTLSGVPKGESNKAENSRQLHYLYLSGASWPGLEAAAVSCLIIQIKDSRWLVQGGWGQCPRVDIGHKAIAELAESPAQLSYFWRAGGCSGYQVKNGVHIEPEFLRPAIEYSVRETIKMH